MNTSQYNFFIHNEPNFQSFKDWENEHIDQEFSSDMFSDNSQDANFLKPIAGMDWESDFLKALKENY